MLRHLSYFVTVMNSDTTINYYDLFARYVARIADLTRSRDEIDREITKLRELMLATFPLLPTEKQRLFQKEIDEIEEQSGSLIAAIKLVFSHHKGEWLTPPQVRDHLNEMGFDLTKYRANPLASIGTTLKRLPAADTRIETKVLDNGQTAYQRRITLLDQIGLEYKQGLNSPSVKAALALDPNKFPDEIRSALGFTRQSQGKKK
jgi:hypothetical protein